VPAKPYKCCPVQKYVPDFNRTGILRRKSMNVNSKKSSIIDGVKSLVKFTALATIGVVIVAPSAIIAIGVYYCTGGKDNPNYSPYPLNDA
jgi:hypothetical protein